MMSQGSETESPEVTRAARDRRARVEIAIDQLSDHTFWADLAMDLERGGVFVATYQVLELGTVVDLSVALPDGAEPIVVSGVVRWMRPHLDGSDGAAGVGIKFLELHAVAQARVERFSTVRPPMMFELDDAPMRRRSAA